MHENLNKARIFSESVRYSGDSLRTSNVEQQNHDNLHSFFSLNSILVSPLVTPIIHSSVNNVIERLQIPLNSVKSYVYASPEIQAECYAGNEVDCIVRMSSGLIDILENDELDFVVGHELGHFLYSHSLATIDQTESIEYLIQKRAQEISADRIGLLASKSLDASIRALMKTISGLSTKYLEFNVGAFLSQLSNTSNFKSQLIDNSSHPSMLVRCRALMWFSMCGTYKSGSNNYSTDEINKLNSKIQSDIDKFVDSKAREKIKELKRNLAIWLSAAIIIKDGTFDKDEQDKFAEMFDPQTLKKLKKYLSNLNSSEVIDSVEEKVNDAKIALYQQIPTSYEAEWESLNQSVKTNFN